MGHTHALSKADEQKKQDRVTEVLRTVDPNVLATAVDHLDALAFRTLGVRDLVSEHSSIPELRHLGEELSKEFGVICLDSAAKAIATVHAENNVKA